MDIKKYKDSLADQYAALDGHIAKAVAAISLPASKKDLNPGKSNFLTKSGWVYNIVGVIAFIAGLFAGSGAIWITGCAAVTAGVYCLIKGKQQLEKEAYDAAGASLLAGIDKVVAYSSKTWTDYVVAQNVALRGDIVTSQLDTIAKVKALGWLTDSSWLHVKADAISQEIAELNSKESLDGYRAWLPKVAEALREDMKLAYTAQLDVLNGVASQKPAPAAQEVKAPAATDTSIGK